MCVIKFLLKANPVIFQFRNGVLFPAEKGNLTNVITF